MLLVAIAFASVWFAIVFGPPILGSLVSRGFDSLLVFFVAIYAGLIGYVLVRERLIFGAEASEEESGSDNSLS